MVIRFYFILRLGSWRKKQFFINIAVGVAPNLESIASSTADLNGTSRTYACSIPRRVLCFFGRQTREENRAIIFGEGWPFTSSLPNSLKKSSILHEGVKKNIYFPLNAK